MGYEEAYSRWAERVDDAVLAAELKTLKNKKTEQRARFEQELEFGTAGLRGLLGAGTARMNIYTVRRAAQGLAEYLIARYGEATVAVAYDSRHMSLEFARESAAVLAANDVTAYLYDRIMPVPLLSFAVRELGARAGIMITASHNPAQYNGFKVYGPDGCQLTIEDAVLVYQRIKQTDPFDNLKRLDFEAGIENGGIKYIGRQIVERYYEEVKKQQLCPGICERYPISVLYSPLHGSGNEPVRQVLQDIGVKDLSIVTSQEQPDGDFPTCPYPNPETAEALALGLELCKTLKPDLYFATDPDADRVGVAVRSGDGYRILTGNEVGALLLNYIIDARAQTKTMPERPVAVRSIVSTALADDIARDGGVEMKTVLTGFKFIGEQILLLEQQNEKERFIFGFEESCGYLAGSYVRDKDAVVACMLLCEMASFYRQRSKPVIAVLEELYQKYGYYRDATINVRFDGPNGAAKMQALMDRLFEHPPEKVGDHEVTVVCDYRSGVRHSKTLGTKTAIGLPLTEVMGLTLENGASIIIRPSGTEPMMKVYLTVKEPSPELSDNLLFSIKKEINTMFFGST